MGWFKRLMGMEAPNSGKDSKWVANPIPASVGPLGLASGKELRFDSTLKLLLDGNTGVVIPDAQPYSSPEYSSAITSGVVANVSVIAPA